MTINELNDFLGQMGNITKIMSGEKVSTSTDEEMIEGAKKLGLKTPHI